MYISFNASRNGHAVSDLASSCKTVNQCLQMLRLFMYIELYNTFDIKPSHVYHLNHLQPYGLCSTNYQVLPIKD